MSPHMPVTHTCRPLFAVPQIVGLLCLAAACPARDMSLVRGGRPTAEIVVGQTPSAQARSAAEELQSFLQLMSGAKLPIVPSAGGQYAVTVLVGHAAAEAAAAEAGLRVPSGLGERFDDEGYLVATLPGKLILAGNETDPYEGTWYAVYDLLHSLGCRWYFPGEFGQVVPPATDITVPAVCKTVRPQLRVRDTWYSGHLAVTAEQSREFDTWKRRNRMSQRRLWAHCADPEARFLQNPVDDSTYRLLPRDKYWEGHPEFYAMTPGGGRNDRFLCMSSPGALQAAADTVSEHFSAHPDHHTFAFSPPDEPVLCHCPDCTAAMHGGYGAEGNGAVSDAYFGFVFRLADEVARRAPGRYITTMAYYNRCRPPEGVEGKRDNLLIQLASIQQCTLHSYADESCASRQEYAAMLRRWQELTAGQVFYEYDPHDWSHSQRPAWRSQGIAEDLRLLFEGGGWGFSNEGQMAWMATGLNYYLRARLAWDLSQDPAREIADFCRRFFGPAAEPMQQYYSSVEGAIRHCPTHLHAFSAHSRDAIPALFPAHLRARWARLFVEAAADATEEPFASRVRAFRLHCERLDAFARSLDAAAAGDYRTAARLADKMVRTVADMDQSALLQDAGPWGGACSGGGMGDFFRDILPWTDGTLGHLREALPDVALFRTDPASEGVVQRWAVADADESWRPLPMAGAWQHSGILTPEGRPYTGIAWYKLSVDFDPGPDPRVGLYVPDLRGSELWLWCNGALAGYMKKGDGAPVLDLTGKLSPGPNALTFRVEGTGGLALPPFLYTPTQAPLTELASLPAQWLLRTDPEDRGRTEGWARPDLDESQWRAVPVPAEWGETWVGDYDGVAWYRVRFTVPAEAAGKRIVLRFGAVDEEAWVYLDGELVGEHTEASTGRTVHQIWDKPFDIELPGAVAGQEHLLAVRVADATMAGGIYKPVRLYLGGGQ